MLKIVQVMQKTKILIMKVETKRIKVVQITRVQIVVTML